MLLQTLPPTCTPHPLPFTSLSSHSFLVFLSDVRALAQSQEPGQAKPHLGQAKPGHCAGPPGALAWPANLKSQSRWLRPGLWSRVLFVDSRLEITTLSDNCHKSRRTLWSHHVFLQINARNSCIGLQAQMSTSYCVYSSPFKFFENHTMLCLLTLFWPL